MRTRTTVLIGMAALFLAAIITNRFLPGASTELPGTEALFAANFADSSGKMQPLSQYRGKVLVVNFWATWCPPCREEMPELDVLHQKYKEQGVVIVGIATDDAAKMREFAAEAQPGYPLLAGDMDGMSLAASMGNDRSILPYTLVIDRQGRIISSIFGRIDKNSLERSLQPLL